MADKHTDTTARIVRILVDCGMIANEELEIVRCLILNPASGRERFKPEPLTCPAEQASHTSRTTRPRASRTPK
jgi:hypothetical protein